jgi:hypothetical protein
MHSSLRQMLAKQRIHELRRTAGHQRLLASSPRARQTRPRLVITVALTIALAAATAGAIAGAAGAQTPQPATGNQHQALCHITLPLRVTPTATDHARIRTFGWDTDPGSCTGTLGPWVMGGQQGWTAATGTLELIRSRAGHVKIAGGDARLSGALPRFAWFHPPMVAFTSTLQLHRADHALQVTGRGQLKPTAQSPVSGRFTIAGSAAIRRARTGSRTIPILTLQLSVASQQSP